MNGEGPPVAYDGLARFLHWLTALLVAIVVGLGWALAWTPRNAASRDFVLWLHRSVGLLVLVAMLLRLLWRWRRRPPPLPESLPLGAALLARATHYSLYLLLILMPLAGYLNAAFEGHAVSFFGLFVLPPLLREDDRLSQFAILVHLAGQYFLYILIALHLGAAFLHGVVLRDGVVWRMLSPARLRRG